MKVSFRVEPSAPGGGPAPTGDVWVMGVGQCKAPVAAGGCSLIIHEAGAATLTAIYYGDSNFLPSTSTNVVRQKVTDFSILVSTSSPPANGATPEEKPGYQLTVSPRGGFTGSISLACAGLPAGASCSFSPPAVTLNGESNAGSILTVHPGASTPSGNSITVTGVSGSGDPSSGGLTRSVRVYLDVSPGPGDVSSHPSAGSGGSASAEILQVVRQHPIVFTVDLGAIVILGGFLLWFASSVVHRERARKRRRPRPQIVAALWFAGIILTGIIIAIALGGGLDLSKNQMGVVINGWILFAFGISFVFWGLSTYRQYRFYADTAVSTIRSLAMGFVEISGFAMPADRPPAPSPISATPCLLYEVDVEIAANVVGNVQEENWSGYFADCPGGRFYLHDNTGKVLIDVRGAHLDVVCCRFEIKISPSGVPQVQRGRPLLGKPNDSALAAYVSGEGISQFAKPFKPGHQFRLTERCIRPYGRYSVAGTCVENPQPKDELDHNMIVKGTNEKTFEISWHPESEQQDHLLRRAKAAIYGGAVLAVLSMAAILAVLYL